MSWEYGPRAALVVIDMQNDFAEESGSLYVRGGEGLVGPVNAEIARAEAAGSPVFYTQDWHPPSTPHFARDGGIWPVHCVAGTVGAEFVAGLTLAGPVVRKGADGQDGYSGFSVRDPVSGHRTDTELGTLLDRAGVSALVVIGLAGDYCVKETALDGRRLGYGVTVPLALTRFVNLAPGDDTRAAGQLEAAGVLVPAG